MPQDHDNSYEIVDPNFGKKIKAEAKAQGKQYLISCITGAEVPANNLLGFILQCGFSWLLNKADRI